MLINRSDSLHSDVTWTLILVVVAQDTGGQQFQYSPRSDFSISMGGFPHLLLEVSSDKLKERDKNRMLLQASCLVRLGNALLGDQSSTFFVKAIYINHDYCAVEYTLYQRGLDGEVVFLLIVAWQEVLKLMVG